MMMKNHDEPMGMSCNPNWSYSRPSLQDGDYWWLRTGKTNALLSLIELQQPDIDKTYLYVKDPFESKYKLLIKRREKVGIKKLKYPKAFIDYSQAMMFMKI